MIEQTQYPELLTLVDYGEFKHAKYATAPDPTFVRTWYRTGIGFVRNPKTNNKCWFHANSEESIRARFGVPPRDAEPDPRDPLMRWLHAETVRRQTTHDLRLEAALDSYKSFTGTRTNAEDFRVALVDHGILLVPVPREPGKFMLAGTVLAADVE